MLRYSDDPMSGFMNVGQAGAILGPCVRKRAASHQPIHNPSASFTLLGIASSRASGAAAMHAEDGAA